MNGIDFLADTNFLIYLLEGRQETELFADYAFAVSFITEIEMLGRFELGSTEEVIIGDLLDNCLVFEMNSVIKKTAIKLKQKKKIKLPDAIIAATAIYYHLTLLTSDTGFNGIDELNVVFIEIGN